MKNCFLLAICILAFPYLRAQTYTSGHLTVTVNDSMWHDSTYCQSMDNVYYTITVNSSFTGDSVILVDTTYAVLLGTYYNATGASPWTFNTTTSGEGGGDGVPPGSYMYFTGTPTKVASTSDTIWGVTYYDSLLVTNPCSWSNVQGLVYIDNNADCVFNSGDVPLNGVNLNFMEYLSSPVDSSGYPGYSDSFGYYNFSVQQSWMVNYVISIPSWYAFIFPASPCFSGTSYTLTTLPVDSANFPLECTSNVDLQVGELSADRVRLHRGFYMQPYVSNTGCDTESGQMTLVLDPRVSYDSALSLHPADTVRGDTLIWNYSGLSSIASGAYWNSFFSEIYLNPDSTLVVGDTLCFRVYTQVPLTDVDPYNNDYSFCMPTVYSYDPNSKEVSPQGNIPAGGDTLTYTIHFQNTGSDTAENITIIDTLNTHFNMHTLKILGASSNMTPSWLAPNVVQFYFSQINLPDSSENEPASHGEVQFSIVFAGGLPYGSQLSNNAYIYFDENPPVVTNTAVDTVALPSSVINVKAGLPVKVYPNPATDKIVVENLDGGEISILNMSGSIVMRQDVSGNSFIVDMSRLADGVYIIKAVNSDNSATIKFTKQ